MGPFVFTPRTGYASKEMNDLHSSAPTWLAWLRLARVSALPSALSNILMGYLLVNTSWEPWSSLALLLFASACLYSSGMILNDYFDRDVDHENSPERPIPSGQISPDSALLVGLVLCGMGVSSAAISGVLAGNILKPLAVAISLAMAIFAYDWILKKTFVAPLFMGLCRSLNVMLGASVAGIESIAGDQASYFGFSLLVYWVAGSIGVYVTGLTLFARDERRVSVRGKMIAGLLIMSTGVAGLALIPETLGDSMNREKFANVFMILILLVAVTIVRSSLVAIWSSKPNNIQSAVITALRSLIIFDACIVFLMQPNQVTYPIIVVSLLAVSLFLGMKIRST